MFKVGGVKHTGSQEHDGRIFFAQRSQPLEILQELGRLLIDRPDLHVGKQVGKQLLHDQSVFQNVRHA